MVILTMMCWRMFIGHSSGVMYVSLAVTQGTHLAFTGLFKKVFLFPAQQNTICYYSKDVPFLLELHLHATMSIVCSYVLCIVRDSQHCLWWQHVYGMCTAKTKLPIHHFGYSFSRSGHFAMLWYGTCMLACTLCTCSLCTLGEVFYQLSQLQA